MKFPSRTHTLIAVAGILLVLSVVRWIALSFGDPALPALRDGETWHSANILPNAENLHMMARQWKERIAALPPEEREASEQRLAEETRFFIEAQRLPAAGRSLAIDARIEELMNDPGIQADWAGERIKMLAGMPPEERREMMRQYIRSKHEKK